MKHVFLMPFGILENGNVCVELPRISKIDSKFHAWLVQKLLQTLYLMLYNFYGYLGRDIPLPAVMSRTNGSLAISEVEENNEGWYVCEAENIGGKTRLQVFLKVSLTGRGNSNICYIKQ